MKKSTPSFRDEDLEQYKKFLTEKKDCIVCGSPKFAPWAKTGSYRAVQCRECDFIWMRPFLNDEGLNRYYTDYLGRRRLNNSVKMVQREIQYQSDKTFIEHYIPEGKVLDVGCSGGFFLNALNDKFKKYGIEIDPVSVEYAKEHFSFGKNVQCVALEDAPFAEKTFDLVLMRGTIEHVPDPVGAIKKVSSLLKPNGYYYITATPNGASFAADLYRDRWTLFHPVQHIWHFSPKTLSKICEKFNLRLVAVDFPYLGTPYEKVRENVLDVAAEIKRQEKGKKDGKIVSPPFWENMMSIVFQKKG